MSELVVHVIPPAWGLPSIGPFCLKLEAHLRMADVPYRSVVDATPFKGPKGKLTMSVEPRLVPLFQRSFPSVRVGAHATFDVDGRTVRVAPFLDEQDLKKIDLWAPLASLLQRFRNRVEAYPATGGYLTADPERVAHWRQVLATADPASDFSLRVAVPAAALAASDGVITIETDKTFVPHDRSGSPDRRTLGLRIFGLNVE